MKITMVLQPLNSIGICLCLCILILDLVNANATVTPTNSRLAVELTLVERASLTGAYCLDGSLPAYRFHPGFGSGANNWLLQFEGGGWCNTIQSCIERTKTHRGSSWLIPKYGTFFGILSNDSDENPDFYNWNRVKLMYCDGASFAGDVDHQVSGLYFRGQRIWKAIIDDLLEKGLDKAKKALLSGCSAGGLSVFLHCDNFRQRLPPQTTVKCLSDAGFFLDSRDVSGSYHIRSFYNDVVTLQNVTQNLQKECIASQPSPSKCFFPQYMLPYIQTPFFVLNSGYDTWQIHNILAPPSTDPHRTWQDCAQRVESCDSLQLATERAYRAQMLHALAPLRQSETGGLFINSCFIHCQSETTNTWFAPPSTLINNKTIAKVVGDWYFSRDAGKEIDCPYPCDKTCYNQPQVPGGIYTQELWN